jgi:hypothetical protein
MAQSAEPTPNVHIVIDSGPQKGRKFPLGVSQAHLCGRDKSCAIPLEDPMVSRQHFLIQRLNNGGFHLEDLGSINGTFINHVRIEKKHPIKLNHGDRITAGETALVYFDAASPEPLIGLSVSGFEVLERIGSGGMGTVYKARQKSLDRLVALKVLAQELADNRKFTELFHREARAAGQINHPSLVQVYDVDTVKTEAGEVTFYAMEFMAQGSLEDVLARESKIDADRAPVR